MIMIADRTGRFPERPYYRIEEIESDCEELIAAFLTRRYGQIVLPVPTPAVVEMLERESADLDLYCDLSCEGEEINGLTTFFPGDKPRVSIARELSYQAWREHRLRSTLTHEYAHVHFHSWLYDRYCSNGDRHKCARGKLLPREGEPDWMEWQAGYMSGVLLMPKSRVELHLRAFLEERAIGSPLGSDSIESRVLIRRTSELFNVSGEAAEVRLKQLGHLHS